MDPSCSDRVCAWTLSPSGLSISGGGCASSDHLKSCVSSAVQSSIAWLRAISRSAQVESSLATTPLHPAKTELGAGTAMRVERRRTSRLTQREQQQPHSALCPSSRRNASPAGPRCALPRRRSSATGPSAVRPPCPKRAQSDRATREGSRLRWGPERALNTGPELDLEQPDHRAHHSPSHLPCFFRPPTKQMPMLSFRSLVTNPHSLANLLTSSFFIPPSGKSVRERTSMDEVER